MKKYYLLSSPIISAILIAFLVARPVQVSEDTFLQLERSVTMVMQIEDSEQTDLPSGAAGESAPVPPSNPSTSTSASSSSAKSTPSSSSSAPTSSSSAKSTPPSSGSSSTPSSSSNKSSAIIATAKQYIGVPYVYGGTSPSGFDCSGFVQYVYKQHGISLPRVSRDQYNTGTAVSFSNLQPGDLVFFSLAANGIVDHVGIYIGGNQFINAASSKGVTIYSLGDYWTSHYLGAKRVF